MPVPIKDRTQLLLREERKNRRLLFVGAGVALLLVSFWAFDPNDDTTVASAAVSLLRELVPDLLAAWVIVSISYWLFRRTDSVRRDADQEEFAESLASQVRQVVVTELQHARLLDSFYGVPWNDLIAHSMSVRIVVHYFDGWIDYHETSLVGLFRRGGSVELILPDYSCAELLATINQRFPDKTPMDLAAKIQATVRKLDKITRAAGNPVSSVSVTYVDHLPLYCAVLFDKAKLVVSPFEHGRDEKVRAPAFVISPTDHNNFMGWFESEWKSLMARSVEPRH